MKDQEKLAAHLHDFCVSFDGRVVLKNISLDLPVMGISVCVGRSGSGKSTLLRVFNRLNDEFAACESSGVAQVDFGDGLEPLYPKAVRPLTEIRRRAGMVFQSPNVLPLSVLRNIVMPLELAMACPAREAQDRARLALEATGLWAEVKERLDLPADRLSGGQQQRLCLARALALEPTLLLLDEPTASLDVRATAQVETLLQSLAQSYPILMVSHSPAQSLRLGDRLMLMEGGRVLHPFTPVEGLTEPTLRAMLGAEKQEEAGAL